MLYYYLIKKSSNTICNAVYCVAAYWCLFYISRGVGCFPAFLPTNLQPAGAAITKGPIQPPALNLLLSGGHHISQFIIMAILQRFTFNHYCVINGNIVSVIHLHQMQISLLWWYLVSNVLIYKRTCVLKMCDNIIIPWKRERDVPSYNDLLTKIKSRNPWLHISQGYPTLGNQSDWHEPQNRYKNVDNTDHAQNQISSEGVQDTPAWQFSALPAHTFSTKCLQTANFTYFT